MISNTAISRSVRRLIRYLLVSLVKSRVLDNTSRNPDINTNGHIKDTIPSLREKSDNFTVFMSIKLNQIFGFYTICQIETRYYRCF